MSVQDSRSDDATNKNIIYIIYTKFVNDHDWRMTFPSIWAYVETYKGSTSQTIVRAYVETCIRRTAYCRVRNE